VIDITPVGTIDDLPSLWRGDTPPIGAYFLIRETGIIVQAWRWIGCSGDKAWVPVGRVLERQALVAEIQLPRPSP